MVLPIRKQSMYVAVAGCLAATACSADGVSIRDVRLGLTNLATDASTHWITELANGKSTDDTYSRESDSRIRVNISYVTSIDPAKPFGAIWGLGIAREAAKISGYDESWNEEITQKWEAVILDGQLGIAYVLNEFLHVEAAGVLGVGLSSVGVTGVSGLDLPNQRGSALEYGIRVGIYTTIDWCQLGLEGGFMSTKYANEWSIDPSIGGGTYKEETDFKGAFAGLTLGVRI